MSGKAWFSQLKSRFVKSPVASNVLFGFVLTVLEKLVEMEFVCPCDSKNSTVFIIGFFIVPPVLGFVLMINIQGYKEKTYSERGNILFFSFVPVIVWLILLFFDGQYFACLMTDWSGRFVIAPEAANRKWCEPTNSSSSSEDKLQKTLKFYSQSQDIGMGLAIFFIITSGLYASIRCMCERRKTKKTEHSPGVPMTIRIQEDVCQKSVRTQSKSLQEEMDTTSKTEEAIGFE